MARRKTTPEERRRYIEEQRAVQGSNPNRRILGDQSFIDKKGNIVHPTKADYESARRGRYNAQHEEAIALNEQYGSLEKFE